MDEKEFQLELERFKQKERWENKIFYSVLIFLLGVFAYYIEGNKLDGQSFLLWLGGLSLLMLVVEFLLEGYLNTQKEILRKKILGKNTKVWNDEKIRQLVVLEKKLNKRNKNLEKINLKIANLKNEIFGGKK